MILYLSNLGQLPLHCLSTNYFPIAPQQSVHHNFGIDGSKVAPLGFCPKFVRTHALREGFEVPRYFFHVKRGQMTVLDQDGIELDNDAQAEKEAAHRVRRIVGDDALNGSPVSDQTGRGMIIVADENWRRLFELRF